MLELILPTLCITGTIIGLYIYSIKKIPKVLNGEIDKIVPPLYEKAKNDAQTWFEENSGVIMENMAGAIRENIMKSIITAVIFSICSISLASTPDLNSLRKSIEPEFPKFQSLFNKAEKLKPLNIKLKKSISQADCKNFTRTVKQEHPINCQLGRVKYFPRKR